MEDSVHQHLFAGTLLASVVGLMGTGLAVAQPSDQVAAAPMGHQHDMKAMKMGAMKCDCWKAGWAIDGIFGPNTLWAVREFQEMHSLHEDGVVGPKTAKALGLPYNHLIKVGAKGEEVRAVQRALRACYMMMNTSAKPTAKPTAAPTAKPTAMPTPAPTAKPTAAPTARPTAAPTAKPSAAATAKPSAGREAVKPEVDSRSTLDLRAGDWMLPVDATAPTAYDWTFKRPTWNGSASLWMGDFGIGGGVTAFPSFQAVPAAAPVGPVYMYNGDLKWRGPKGYLSTLIGYRGLNTQNLNFGEVGFEWLYPIASDWLYLQVNASGGYNFSNAYFVDGLGGLELRLGPVGLDLGYRDMYLNGVGGSNNMGAPQGSIHLGF
jgi:hypothetical protein